MLHARHRRPRPAAVHPQRSLPLTCRPALEAARLAAGDGPVSVLPSDAASAQGRTVGKLRVGGETLAVSDSSAIRLYLPKSTAVPSTSAARLLSGYNGGRRVIAGSNAQLKDKIVLIGLDTELGAPVRTARGEMAPAAAHALAAARTTTKMKAAARILKRVVARRGPTVCGGLVAAGRR